MVYLEYEAFKVKYLQTLERYNEILSEKEELFNRTQPKSVRYDKERVAGGDPSNAFDEYLIKKEEKRIDDRLMEVKSLVDDRKQLLNVKEQELRVSKDTYDKVYRMRFLDRLKVRTIASMLRYSEAQIYRMLHTISETLKR